MADGTVLSVPPDLVAQAARRVTGAAGSPDTGWAILGLPVAR